MKKIVALTICIYLLTTAVPAFADCTVEEVVFYVNQLNLSADDIRGKCRNSVDVSDCSLSKVIKMVKDGNPAQKIYDMCKPQ